ncbi:MAG TPA: septum formation initiator family protein [Dissulfurispiraceae bacterium]
MGGRIQPRNLRQQVVVERKRRDVIFFTVFVLLFLYMGVTLLFGNMGLLKYSKLRHNGTKLENEIHSMEQENKTLKSHVSALKENSFYAEKYAREEYGLARPDEYIFQFSENDK